MANYYLDFDGNQYVTVSENTAWLFREDDFTISLWVKTTDTSNPIFLESTSYNIGWNIRILTNKARLTTIGTSGTAVVSHNTEVNDGDWHHIAWSFTAGGTCAYYFDGTSDGAAIDVSGTGDMNELGDLLIGGTSPDNPSGVAPDYVGSIDDIRIYKGLALSAAQILSIYNNGIGLKITGNESNLSWGSNCDTGSGLILADITETQNGVLSSEDIWVEGGVGFGNTYQKIYQYLTENPSDLEFVRYAGEDDATARIPIPSTDGEYNFIRTNYDDNCDSESEESNAVTVIVENGVGYQLPLFNPSNLRLIPIADGKFYLYFNYQYNYYDNITHFNIYYTNNPSAEDWTYDGQLIYRQTNSFRYTTKSQEHNVNVTYKVVPAIDNDNPSAIYERDNDITVTGKSDAKVPTVSDDTIELTLE